MLASVVDQSMRFGQKKLVALRIEFRGARERERAAIRRNGLSKNGLAPLTVFRRLPLANVQNQDACRSQRTRECGEHR
jgi:hypothetical protein